MPDHLSAAQFAAALEAAEPNAGVRASMILDWAKDSLDEVLDPVGVEVVIQAALEFYDLYVAPIDIPGVPEIIERNVIDVAAKRFLTALIRGFHARIHKD